MSEREANRLSEERGYYTGERHREYPEGYVSVPGLGMEIET